MTTGHMETVYDDEVIIHRGKLFTINFAFMLLGGFLVKLFELAQLIWVAYFLPV